MKKIIYGFLATLSGLVLIFSYRTSLEVVPPTVAEPATTGAASTTNVGSAGSSSFERVIIDGNGIRHCQRRCDGFRT